MKQTILIVLLAACTLTAVAQAPAKPTSDAKPAATATAPITAPAAKPTSVTKAAATADKPPAHMTPVKGIHKTLYTVTLGYQDVKIGTGAEAEPKKLLKCYYTIWLAAGGSKLDSSDDHRAPVLDKDKKPVLGDNGKPPMGDPQPATLVMGAGRPLPGWDLGFKGMKAGGKRRIFVPWQLGLGDRDIPARDATHPAVPAKSDLVVDVELLEVMDAPPQPVRPTMMPGQRPAPGASPKLAAPATPATPTAPAAPPAAPAPPAPANAAQPK